MLSILLPLITTPYISRVLQANAVGAYSYSLSMTTYFSLFGIMGLNMYGQLKIAGSRTNKEDYSCLFWEIFVSKAITSMLSLLLFSFFIEHQYANKAIFIALSILLIANIFDISWFFQGMEMFKKIAMRNYIIKLLSLILIIIYIKEEKDVILYAIIIQGSTLLGNLSLWLSLGKYVHKHTNDRLKIGRHLTASLVYFLPTVASSIYTVLDKSMLGWIVESDYENGVYEQAHKIQQTAVMIITALSQVMLPRMTYLFREGKMEEYSRFLKQGLCFVGILSMPMVAGLFIVSDTFIPIFLGKGFDKCIPLLRIFSILVFFSGINTLIGNQCLVARGKQELYNRGVILGAVSNIILNIIFIPLLASIGAAIASVIAEVIIFACFLMSSRDCNIILQLSELWLKPAIASVLMIIIIWPIGFFINSDIIRLTLQILIGIVVYFVFLLIMKENTIINILYSFLKRINLSRNNKI